MRVCEQNLLNYGCFVEYQESKNIVTYWLVWLDIIPERQLGFDESLVYQEWVTVSNSSSRRAANEKLTILEI